MRNGDVSDVSGPSATPFAAVRLASTSTRLAACAARGTRTVVWPFALIVTGSGCERNCTAYVRGVSVRLTSLTSRARSFFTVTLIVPESEKKLMRAGTTLTCSGIVDTAAEACWTSSSTSGEVPRQRVLVS